MEILCIGGTGFLSHYIVEAALSRGHNVTLFHRGQTRPELFSDLEHVRGDREKDLDALSGRYWNAVIDICGYVPRIVRKSVEFFANTVEHYTFISSISVYGEPDVIDFDESYPVGKLQDETIEEVTGESYGPLKALCEQVVEQHFPARSLIIRPGLIAGPADPTGRTTYWPYRLAQDGEVLVPDHKDQPLQFVDARDLAEWNIRLVEEKQVGTYNATGPAHPLTLQQFLEQCKTISAGNVYFTWVSEEFLLENGVEPWSELPLWIPRAFDISLNTANVHKALTAGLTLRPLPETLHDMLTWIHTYPDAVIQNKNLAPEREAELLHTWHKKEE
jgi:2'-hydroxyisoflavone reductase